MNFDGKAFVVNSEIKTFISDNGSSFVVKTNEKASIDFNSSETNFNIAFVIPEHKTNEKEMSISNIKYLKGLIPYTVQINDNTKIGELTPINFVIIRDSQKQKSQDFTYIQKKAYVSVLQPTNIKYNSRTAVVYDSTTLEKEFTFAGVTVNVNSKVEVIIPDKVVDYTDTSIVIQKNSFIEIKVPKNVSEVLNVPEQLTYSSGYIKGIFTKSGEYNIRLKYQDGEQILNIIVPYYQRIL